MAVFGYLDEIVRNMPLNKAIIEGIEDLKGLTPESFAELKEGERERFFFSGDQTSSGIKIKCEQATIYDYKVSTMNPLPDAQPASEDSATSHSFLTGRKVYTFEPSLLVIMEASERLAVYPKNNIGGVSGTISGTRLVLRWEDPKNDTEIAQTTYQVIIKRQRAYLPDPIVSRATVTAVDGTAQECSVAFDGSRGFRADDAYTVKIKLRRIGPAYKDLWSMNKSCDIYPTPEDPADPNLDDLIRE